MSQISKVILINSLFILLLSLFGCTPSNQNVKSLVATNSNPNTLYAQINSAIKQKELDSADDNYIELKTASDENSQYLKKAAANLAIAHIAQKEYILANFYIQEALQVDSSDATLRYLLVKNQFLSAAQNRHDQTYMQKAIKALEINKNLQNSSDYRLLANSMAARVKINIAFNNKEVSDLYKRLNKDKASTIYENRVKLLGLDASEIVQP